MPSGRRSSRRLVSLRAALGFLHVPPIEPELRLLHRCDGPGALHRGWLGVAARAVDGGADRGVGGG
jgi:hypothetical protein